MSILSSAADSVTNAANNLGGGSDAGALLLAAGLGPVGQGLAAYDLNKSDAEQQAEKAKKKQKDALDAQAAKDSNTLLTADANLSSQRMGLLRQSGYSSTILTPNSKLGGPTTLLGA